MEEIYASFSKLLVWLRPGFWNSTLALEIINRAGRFFHDQFRDPSDHQLSPQEYYVKGLPKLDLVKRAAVYRLSKRSYFPCERVQ